MTLARSQLDRYRTAEFSLEELAAAAARLLRRLAFHPGDGRVATAPDARAIRFYQTAGVVDRPVRYEGRRAVYGFRHLVQLLAVKQLQQDGQPLALIQRALQGRSADELENRLRLVDADPAGHGTVLPAADATTRTAAASAVDGEPGMRPLLAVELEPGIVVTIDTARVGDARAVASQLTDALARIRGRE